MTIEPEDAEWRRSRRRRTLAWLGAGLLVTGLVGSIAGYIWYDRATRIDRSTPSVVVERYVYTIFDDRDLAGAEALECRDGSRQNIRSLLTDIEDLERTYNILVTVSTANYSTTILGDQADVEVALRIDVPEEDRKPSRSTQHWRFHLRDDDGWRVCDASRLD